MEDLEKFYNRDDISRSTTGKRETRTKNKIKVQIRYLVDTMQNYYKIYREKCGNVVPACLLASLDIYSLETRHLEFLRSSCDIINFNRINLRGGVPFSFSAKLSIHASGKLYYRSAFYSILLEINS